MATGVTDVSVVGATASVAGVGSLIFGSFMDGTRAMDVGGNTTDSISSALFNSHGSCFATGMTG